MKQDITDEKLLLDRITHLALRDELTGLYKRSALLDRMMAITKEKTARRGRVSLLMIDLDGFKGVNDRFGHEAGDICLKRIAGRLDRLPVGRKLTSRQGGDEFAILIENASSDKMVDEIADRILSVVAKPIRSTAGVFQLGASIGIASRAIGSHLDPAEMMREADIAMYQAKQSGRNCRRRFDPAMLLDFNRRLETLRLIRQALETGKLRLHYQPKIATADGSRVGFEALLRWQHPDGSIRAPIDFADAMWDRELSRGIGDFVIDAALSQARSWLLSGIAFGHVAINISASQLNEPNFAGNLLARIREHGLASGMIEIELTESIFLSKSPQHVHGICEDLRKGGVSVVFDDFGRGYASLTHLRELPVDAIKLDGSFISRIGQDAATPAIIQAIVALAHALGVKVVAEGVETQAQAAFLKAIRCDFMQGFLYGRAAPAEQVADWLPFARRRA